jgi:hypothetical protein
MKPSGATDTGMRVDEAVQVMLTAFAGRPVPGPGRPAARKRAATRRTAIVLVAAIALLVLAVPGSLALVRAFSQSPQQFIADQSQPVNARAAIERYMERVNASRLEPALTGIEQAVTATTPDGEYRVYALAFDGGDEGIAIISSKVGGVAALAYGPSVRCTGPWALQAGPSFVAYPGKTPLYVTGHASTAVSSVEVDYPDGSSTPAEVANGYFLAWVTASRDTARAATITARDSAGATIGELHVTSGGAIPRTPGQSPQEPSCG